jgi:hypothetical protein
VAGKCPASFALWAGSRGIIKMRFHFREASACLSRPSGVAGKLHYRVIFDIEGNEIVVLRVGHRREIYRRK